MIHRPAAVASIGGATVDRRGILHGPALTGASNSGRVSEDFGGVARNVAENLARLGVPVTLVSRVGDDAAGCRLLEHARALGIDTAGCTISRRTPTASYTAILERSGELLIGLDDMGICEEMTREELEPAVARLGGCAHWFMDTNLPGETIAWLLEAAGEIPVSIDAISPARAVRLIQLLPRIPLLFANLSQAAVLAGAPSFPDACEAAQALAQTGASAVVVSAGAAGIAVWNRGAVRVYAALPARPLDVTGAGDALIAGMVFGLLAGATLEEAAPLGLAAAAIAVESAHAAPPELTAALLEERRDAR